MPLVFIVKRKKYTLKGEKMKKIIVVLLLTLGACKNLETSIENIAPPAKSKKGDGYIFFDYLNFDKNLTIFDGEYNRFVFRTKAEDVERVDIVVDGKEYPMMSIGKMGDFEYFEGKIKNLKSKKIYFRINDGNLSYYSGKKSSLKEKEVIPFEYTSQEKIEVKADSKLWYRVYIDSFNNGNKENDPLFNEYGPESFTAPDDTLKNGVTKDKLSEAWATNESKRIFGKFEISEWNDDFNNPKNWENKAKNLYGDYFYSKRFGGDLKGIENKISYLKDYGVEVLWLSSPFYSYSGNKNDIIDYRHISPDYGTILNKTGKSEYNELKVVDGKNYLGETLAIDTWVNSESDEIFIDLIKKLNKEGIGLVSDITFDYVSDRFFAYEDILKKGTNSKYKDWFNVKIVEEKVPYSGLSDIGVDSFEGLRYRKTFIEILENYSFEEKQELMKWNKKHLSAQTLGENQTLVKLNLDNTEVQEYLIESSKKWLNAGLLGYVVRLRENSAFYSLWEKAVNPSQKYTIKYDLTDNTGVEKSNQLNYGLSDILYRFLGASSFTGEDLYTNLYILNRNVDTINFIEGIDIERVPSAIINGGREFDTENEEKGNYLGINPMIIDENSLNKYKMGIFTQFLLNGSPSIYYGSEKFMWGGDVPHNRKAMLWDEKFPYMDESDNIKKYESKKEALDIKIVYDQVEGKVRYKIPVEKTLEDFYKKLVKFRNDNEALIDSGVMDKIKTGPNLLIFSKSFANETYIFVINKSDKDEKVILEVGEGKEIIDYFNGEKKSILKTSVEISLPKYGVTIYKKIKK